jgi:cell division protein FtsB
MINKGKNKNFKNFFLNQKFLAIIGLAVIILISFPFVKNYLKQYQINKEINGLKKEITDLQDKNVDLKKFVSYLESNQFAEEQARLNLNLKKPGEELTVIKPTVSGVKIDATTTEETSIFNIPGYRKGEAKNSGNPEKWLNYFFRR